MNTIHIWLRDLDSSDSVEGPILCSCDGSNKLPLSTK